MRGLKESQIDKMLNQSILRVLILSFSISISVITNAQTFIYGLVQDNEGQPVPYAHLLLKGTNYGTMTNSDGRFRLNIPDDLKESTITISAIGFVSKNIAIANRSGEMTITLSVSILELEAVVIKPVDYGKRLVKAAISNIPNNYTNDKERLTAFSREATYTDTTLNTPYYIIETLIEADKDPYNTVVKTGRTRRLESRKIEFASMDSLGIRFYGGGHIIHRFDLVLSRHGPLNIHHIDNYEFDIIDTLSLNTSTVFVVRFESKNRGRGILQIEEKSFAITHLEMNYNEKEVSTFLEEVSVAAGNHNRISSSYLVNYQSINDRWKLSSVLYKSIFERDKKINLVLNHELIVTNYSRIQAPISYDEQLEYRDLLIYEVGPYDSLFWEGTNILLPNNHLETILRTNPIRDTTRKSQAEKVMGVLQKFQFNYGLIAFSTNAANGLVRYENGISLNEGFATINQSGFGYIGTVSYELKPQFYLGLEQWTSFRKDNFSANFLSTHYDYNLLPNKRPFYISPSLKFGYTKFRQKLPTAYSESNFKVNDKKFDSNKVDVFLEERNILVSPSLSMSIEKNSRLRFYVEVGYNFTITNNSGLFLREDQLLFQRKTAFVPKSDTNLNFMYSKDGFFENSPFISLGITFQY